MKMMGVWSTGKKMVFLNVMLRQLDNWWTRRYAWRIYPRCIKERRGYGKKEHMENIMRRTNIYLIRIPEGETGDNEGKAIFKEIMATNVWELKNINPQIHDI